MSRLVSPPPSPHPHSDALLFPAATSSSGADKELPAPIPMPPANTAIRTSNKPCKTTAPSNEAERKPRRRGRGMPKRFGPQLSQMTTKFRLTGNPDNKVFDLNQAKRDEQISKDQRPPRPVMKKPTNASLSVILSKVSEFGGLDPFFPLSVPLSPSDRALLQYYLTAMPSVWYGTNHAPVFSVVRDYSMPQGIGSDVYLGWMLLAADNVLMKDKSEQRDIVIARRRASNLQKMRELLQDPRNHDLDSTISVLTVAGSAELRLGGVAAGLEHLSAVLHLLRQRRGLRTLQSMSGVTGMVITHVLHMTGIPMLFDSPPRLEQALLQCEVTLQGFHIWNLDCRQQSPLNGSPSHSQHNASEIDFARLVSLQHSNSQNYWQMRMKYIGRLSIIGRFLATQSTELSSSAQRGRTGSLYCLNSILYNLQDNESLAQEFFMDLDYTFRNSVHSESSLGAVGDMLSANKHAALISMITYCAKRHALWFDSESSTTPAMRVWESLEFVELMMLASPYYRSYALEILFLWLTCDVTEADRLAQLGLRELEEIKHDIVSNWNALRNPG